MNPINKNTDSKNYSKCRCCEHIIEVKTIDDMLERAYTVFDNDKALTQLLFDLNIDKYTVGISQEYTRFKMLSDPYSNFITDYRCVQESESGIYLGFNENFTLLEVIEIMPNIFRNNHIRGWKAQFNSFNLQEKIKFLERVFSKFNPKLQNVDSYIEVREIEDIGDIEIALKMPNERVSNNNVYASFPDSREYPSFTFSIHHHSKDGRLNSIKLDLCQHEAINEPVSKWLHQTTISMYPDYGAYLWFDGAGGGLDSIDGYDFENSELAKKFDEWQNIFEKSWKQTDTNWEEFNKTGRELFLELRDVIKQNYILTYAKSYEETCGTHEEIEENEKKAMEFLNSEKNS